MTANREIFQFADIRVDPGKRIVSRTDGTLLHMPSKVFDLLIHLIEHRNDVISKEQLMSAVWPDTAVEENNLNKAVSTIRKLLDDRHGDNRYIVTVPGRGYKFVADVEVLESAQLAVASASLSGVPVQASFWTRPVAVLSVVGLALTTLGFYYLKSYRTDTSVAQIRAERPSTQEATNPEAYELLLQARSLRDKPRGDDWVKATEYYERAVAAAPGYAVAHAELAQHYIRLASDSFSEPRELIEKAGRAATKAVELDENLPEAHIALAGYYLNNWNWSESEREYLRAIELNPTLARAHLRYSALLSVLQRHEEAINEARRARELDPLSVSNTLAVGVRLQAARRFDEALNEFERLPELPQNLRQANELIAFAYAGKGLYQEAVRSFEKMEQSADEESPSIFIAAIYAKAGDLGKARAKVAALESNDKYVSPAELAILYVSLGENEKAISSLESAYRQRDPQLRHIGYDWFLDPIRNDARFIQLLQRLNLG